MSVTIHVLIQMVVIAVTVLKVSTLAMMENSALVNLTQFWYLFSFLICRNIGNIKIVSKQVVYRL